MRVQAPHFPDEGPGIILYLHIAGTHGCLWGKLGSHRYKAEAAYGRGPSHLGLAQMCPWWAVHHASLSSSESQHETGFSSEMFPASSLLGYIGTDSQVRATGMLFQKSCLLLGSWAGTHREIQPHTWAWRFHRGHMKASSRSYCDFLCCCQAPACTLPLPEMVHSIGLPKPASLQKPNPSSQ